MTLHKDSFDAALKQDFRKQVADSYTQLRKAEGESFKELLDATGRFLPGVAHTRDCPLCHAASDDAKELYFVHGMSIASCRKCGFVYSRQVINQDQDALRYVRTSVANANLELKANPAYEALEAAKAEYIIEKATSLRSTPGGMLDVGCSTGKILGAAKDRGWKVTGIEANSDATLRLVQRGFKVINGFFPDRISKTEDNFDLITMLDVLEHFEDPVAVLHKTQAFLNVDGILAIQVPNLNSLLIRLEGERNNNLCHGHWSYFTPRTLTQTAEKAGFIEVMSETIISELDKIKSFALATIRQTVWDLVGIVVNKTDEIDPDWLHQHLLGYKILALYRKAGR